MPRQYTDEQIGFALRQAGAGTSVEAICRKLGVAEATFCRWRKKFGGLGVAEISTGSFLRSRTRTG